MGWEIDAAAETDQAQLRCNKVSFFEILQGSIVGEALLFILYAVRWKASATDTECKLSLFSAQESLTFVHR